MADELMPAASQSLLLRDGTTVDMRRTADGARVTLRENRGGPRMELEIVLTSAGPVVRARAVALEIDVARDLVARCETFRVDAKRGIELTSEGDLAVQARQDIFLIAATGSLRARANDDLQLLGEQVLLNTERQADLPRWLNGAAPAIDPKR